MSSENSQLIRRWFDQVWNQGSVEAIDQMSHPTLEASARPSRGAELI